MGCVVMWCIIKAADFMAADFLAACSTGDNCAGRHSNIAVAPGTMAKFNGYKKCPLRTVTASDDASRLA